MCEQKLESAHEILRDWFYKVKKSFHDVHISWAWRGKEAQDEFVKVGKSRAHWPHSKHNHQRNGKPCSLALDLFQLKDGKAQFFHDFYSGIDDFNKTINAPIRWGARFVGPLLDANHFELNEAYEEANNDSKY
jgi:hypothetical protein